MRFLRDVVLGQFTGTATLVKGCEQPAGIYDTVLGNCVVGHDALLQRVGLISNVVIGPRCVVWNCGRIVCVGSTTFGSDTLVRVGPQTNGRPIPLYPELDVAAAAALATGRESGLLGEYEAIRAEYRGRSRLSSNHPLCR